MTKPRSGGSTGTTGQAADAAGKEEGAPAPTAADALGGTGRSDAAPARKTTGRTVRIGGVDIAPGERRTVDLPLAYLYTHTEMNMPVQVVNGRRAGPTLFVSAAIHGDEINGVEVIRRLLKLKMLRRMRGTLIAVPIVNVLGFLNLSRYLPDRRDLNRSFPGSERGSAAARIAHQFVTEIVSQSDCGIDLHTGAIHRANLPQIRAFLDDPPTLEFAEAFGVPVLIDGALRDGSLRALAAERGLPILVYEAGEALRFDDVAIRAGVSGIQRVMRKLGMLPESKPLKTVPRPVIATESGWLRAPQSGIVRSKVRLGDLVAEGAPLGRISDPFDDREAQMLARFDGIVIGMSRLPLAHEGDAVFNIAGFEKPERVADRVKTFHDIV